MMPTLVSLLAVLRDSLRTRVALQAEVLALRHQLLVLQRKRQKQRLRLSIADRLFWVWLSRVWADWRSALRIVKPETVIAWHRKGFRLYWSWKSRHRYGRPPVQRDVQELIRRMSAANPRWGCPAYSRRARQAGHQSLGDNGRQVHGAAPKPAFTNLAYVFGGSRQGSLLRRFLRSSDSHISVAVCVCDPLS